MKRYLLIVPILALIATGCYKKPFADGNVRPNPAWVGEQIEFLNLSQHSTRWEWDFGDGNVGTSANMVHSYTFPGSYEVILNAYGKKGDVSRASFIVVVDGSAITIEVKEYYEEYLIEGASVLLFETLEEWNDGSYELAVDEQFTDQYGRCTFTNLGAKEYYVDVYYRVGNEGYHNYFLAEEDLGFIETQVLEGGFDHFFIAYVDAVIWEGKSAAKEDMRPAVRIPYRQENSLQKGAAAKRELKENRFSTPKEEK